MRSRLTVRKEIVGNFSGKFIGSTAFMAGLLLMSLAILAGCSKKEGAKDGFEVSELRYQGWTGSVLFPELAEDLGYLAPLKLKWVGNTNSGPQDIQATAVGDVDFGYSFTGAIVNLVKAKAPIRLVIASSGIDSQTCSSYYVLEESPIRRGRDLIGKKVAMNTLGAHHEFAVREYLNRDGLTREEIKQVSLVVVPPLSGEQTLRQKQVDMTVLGTLRKEKALERGGIRPLFTDYQLFGQLSTGGYVMTEKFIRENPKAAMKFVEATARAIEWVRSHLREEVIARFEKIIKQRGRNENTEPLKYWKSTAVAGKGGVLAEKEVQIWIDWLVKEGQLKKGEIKAADIYTNELNPYLAEAGKIKEGSSKQSER